MQLGGGNQPPSVVSRTKSRGVKEADLGSRKMYRVEYEYPGGVQLEDLGLYSGPDVAAVAHDIVVAKLAFDSGDQQLSGAADALNFPLSAYRWQRQFWKILRESSLAQLVMSVKSQGLAEELFAGPNQGRGGATAQQAQQQQQAQQGGALEGEPQRAVQAQQQQPQHAAQRPAKGPAPGPAGAPPALNRPPPPPPRQQQAQQRGAAGEGGLPPAKRHKPAPPEQADGRPREQPRSKTQAAATPVGGEVQAAAGPKAQAQPQAPLQRKPPAAAAAAAEPGSEAHQQQPRDKDKGPPARAAAAKDKGGKKAEEGAFGKPAGAAADTAPPPPPPRPPRAETPAAVKTEPAVAAPAGPAGPAVPAGPAAPGKASKRGSSREAPGPSAAAGAAAAAAAVKAEPPSPPPVPSQAKEEAGPCPSGAAAAASGAAASPAAPASPAAAGPAAGGDAAAAAAAAGPAGGAAVDEPRNVWLKNPEWPPGSGKFPLCVKSTQLSAKWFTVSVAAVEGLGLPRDEVAADTAGDEGAGKGKIDFILEDAATGKEHKVKFWVKLEGGKAGTDKKDPTRPKSLSCYFTALTSFVHENKITAMDVVWFKKHGDGSSKALFGIWKNGSREATDFVAELRKMQGAKGRAPAKGKGT